MPKAKETYSIKLPGYPPFQLVAYNAEDAWKRYVELTGCKSDHAPTVTLVAEAAPEPVTDDGH